MFHFSAVCDLPPDKQKQMPMEETGNIVLFSITLLSLSLATILIQSCPPQLALLAYIVERDGDTSFLEPYWSVLACSHIWKCLLCGCQLHTCAWYRPLLEIWGKYLESTLPDPGNQICVDDFEGPSPHNVNLAAKVSSLHMLGKHAIWCTITCFVFFVAYICTYALFPH